MYINFKTYMKKITGLAKKSLLQFFPANTKNAISKTDFSRIKFLRK